MRGSYISSLTVLSLRTYFELDYIFTSLLRLKNLPLEYSDKKYVPEWPRISSWKCCKLSNFPEAMTTPCIETTLYDKVQMSQLEDDDDW